MRKALIVIAVIASTVLGFGYWYVRTHGTLYVSLTDNANPQQYGRIPNAKIEFFDADGKFLARGKTDAKYGVVWVEHPSAGYCGPDISADAYTQCFRQQSTWLMDWVAQARHADLQTGTCRIQHMPVHASVYADNVFLWWIPLPHIGGVPRTNYSFNITIDSRSCSVAR